MGLRSLIPDASGPVPPASNNVRIIWADPKPAPSSAPGMSFAPAPHVQRALQSKPSAAPNPQRDDPVLCLPWQPVRRRDRPRATVNQRLSGPIPIYPSLHRCRRALEPFRRPPQRPAPVHDEDSKTTTPFRRQRRVSVGHEDLRGQDASVVTHILPGGLRLPHPFTTSRGSTARPRAARTDVEARYRWTTRGNDCLWRSR